MRGQNAHPADIETRRVSTAACPRGKSGGREREKGEGAGLWWYYEGGGRLGYYELLL